ncbi:hypothetical protein PINS_up010449 [Pythium insidiosum]|nr:hypothetical protein PINS_up010449 [Pythium insidiosum]
MVYEHEDNCSNAVEHHHVLTALRSALDRSPLSHDVVQSVSQLLFHIATTQSEMLDQDSVVELGIVERLLQYMETRRAECDVLLQWHVLKAVEMLCRSSADRQVDTRRVDLLMQAGAPQFALSVITTPAVVQTSHAAEQAIRLVELLASIGASVGSWRWLVALAHQALELTATASRSGVVWGVWPAD